MPLSLPLPSLWLDIGPDPDIYIAGMQWTPSGDLLLQRIPRLQNRLELLKVDAKTGDVRVLLTETDAAWVDAPGELTFIGDTGQFVWPSERSGFKHLYLYDGDGQMLRQLTSGEWEVDALLGVDVEARRVVFQRGPSPSSRAADFQRVAGRRRPHAIVAGGRRSSRPVRPGRETVSGHLFHALHAAAHRPVQRRRAAYRYHSG